MCCRRRSDRIKRYGKSSRRHPYTRLLSLVELSTPRWKRFCRAHGKEFLRWVRSSIPRPSRATTALGTLWGGIKKVVYIEPYPKSKAKELHDDAIKLGEEIRGCSSSDHVPFVPFVGISPRKYLDIFTVKPIYSREVDRKGGGRAVNWQRKNRTPLRMKMASLSYIERETIAISKLNESSKQPSLRFGASQS